MNIAFIGAGNLATNLAQALAGAGHNIVSVYSRTMQSAAALAEKMGNPGIATDELERVTAADVYIISVKDDAVESIVKRWPSKFGNRLVVHTAGTLPMQLISSASEHYGVLYPLQTFSKNKSVDFKNITCFIEGNDEIAKSTIRTLASSISPSVVELSSEDRMHLHVAAVFACNFVNHMIALGYEIMERHNIPTSALMPLIEETISKLHTMHPHDGQTGPARRGDTKVMEAHLSELADSQELQTIYSILSKSISKRFEQQTD